MILLLICKGNFEFLPVFSSFLDIVLKHGHSFLQLSQKFKFIFLRFLPVLIELESDQFDFFPEQLNILQKLLLGIPLSLNFNSKFIDGDIDPVNLFFVFPFLFITLRNSGVLLSQIPLQKLILFLQRDNFIHLIFYDIFRSFVIFLQLLDFGGHVSELFDEG